MRFSANLSLLFSDVSLLERPSAAADAGFVAAEMWWPFTSSVPTDAEADRFVESFSEAGISLIALNFDAGSMPNGDRGLVSLPGELSRFRECVDFTAELGVRMGCKVFNALYGNSDAQIRGEEQERVAIGNLAYAAKVIADRAEGTVVLEAVNSFENPRYPVNTTAHAQRIIARVREETGETLKLLYDVYHMQLMEGNLIQTLRRNIDQIAHIQLADVPGRHEPGTGEIAFDRLLPSILRCGYPGYFGLEYRPQGLTSESFNWMSTLNMSQ